MAKAPRKKEFDCVKFMREARARSAARTAHMTIDERIAWFNTRRYSDPALEKLAARLRKSTQAGPKDNRED